MSARVRRVALLVVGVVAGALLLTAAGGPTHEPRPPGADSDATAVTIPGMRTVGALFPPGEPTHTCTGTVLDSATHDLLLTAAHCVSGGGSGWTFVPGYDDGATPYGTWTVTEAYAPRPWLHGQDPQNDVVVLRVAPLHGRSLQDVTGGLHGAPAPRSLSDVTVVGYAAGSDDRPIACTVPVYATHGFPTIVCHGYVDGVSGGPWLQVGPDGAQTEHGLVGGLYQGGCTEGTSYSPEFTVRFAKLVQRAEQHRRPDVLPTAGSSGC